MKWPARSLGAFVLKHMTFCNVRFTMIALATAATVLLPLAQATPLVTGVASLNGTSTVTNTTIQFFDNSATGNTLSAAASGNTMSYSTLNGLADTSVEIQELTGGPFSGNLPGPGYVDYTTFNVTNAPTPYSTIDFDLTKIDAGVGTAGACFSDTIGNECTPLVDTTATGDPWVTTCPAGHTCVVSPFTLVQVNGGVDIFMTFEGLSYFAPPAGAGVTASPTVANLSTQGVIETFAGITQVDTGLHSGNGTINSSISATFGSQAVPEPTTAFLALSGLLLIGGGLYRRRARARS